MDQFLTVLGRSRCPIFRDRVEFEYEIRGHGNEQFRPSRILHCGCIANQNCRIGAILRLKNGVMAALFNAKPLRILNFHIYFRFSNNSF